MFVGSPRVKTCRSPPQAGEMSVLIHSPTDGSNLVSPSPADYVEAWVRLSDEAAVVSVQRSPYFQPTIIAW